VKALNEIQTGLLKEMGNIGAGNAATALSKILGAKIEITVPNVWMIPVERMNEPLGQVEELTVALFLKASGGAPGKAVFLLDVPSAERIAAALLGTQPPLELFSNEMAQSALQEVGNIIVSSFLIALTHFSGIPLQSSVPAIGIDMLGAILDGILLDSEDVGDSVLIIDTAFSGSQKIEGKFLFIPDEGSLEKLLGVFGV